jgi:crotonobetainyl-CoA:carnitine CoA-transferase CaiB-like acyl-CoA transferase
MIDGAAGGLICSAQQQQRHRATQIHQAGLPGKCLTQRIQRERTVYVNMAKTGYNAFQSQTVGYLTPRIKVERENVHIKEIAVYGAFNTTDCGISYSAYSERTSIK